MQVAQRGGVDVHEECGEPGEAVEHHGVVPDDDAEADGPDRSHVVGGEPAAAARIEVSLQHARHIDQVAKVQEEEVKLVAPVGDVAGGQQDRRKPEVEGGEPLWVPKIHCP